MFTHVSDELLILFVDFTDDFDSIFDMILQIQHTRCHLSSFFSSIIIFIFQRTVEKYLYHRFLQMNENYRLCAVILRSFWHYRNRRLPYVERHIRKILCSPTSICLSDFHFTSMVMILGISCYEIVDLVTDFHDQDPVVERTVKIRFLIWELSIPFISLSLKIM